jgi:hypothetical protein
MILSLRLINVNACVVNFEVVVEVIVSDGVVVDAYADTVDVN